MAVPRMHDVVGEAGGAVLCRHQAFIAGVGAEVDELVRREAHPLRHIVKTLLKAWGVHHPRAEDEHRHAGVLLQLCGKREG